MWQDQIYSVDVAIFKKYVMLSGLESRLLKKFVEENGHYIACSGERVSNLNVNMNNLHFYIVSKAIHLMTNIQYIFGGSKAKQGKKAGCDLVSIKVGNHI